jgi:hypothetical protein
VVVGEGLRVVVGDDLQVRARGQLYRSQLDPPPRHLPASAAAGGDSTDERGFVQQCRTEVTEGIGERVSSGGGHLSSLPEPISAGSLVQPTRPAIATTTSSATSRVGMISRRQRGCTGARYRRCLGLQPKECSPSSS